MFRASVRGLVMRFSADSTLILKTVAIVTAFFVSAAQARSERFESEKEATHVVVGKVQKVDASWSLNFNMLSSVLVCHYRATIDVEEVVRGQGAEPGTTISVHYGRTYWVPLSLVVVLGVGVLAYRILKRTVRVRWLRWALTVVLFVVIFFGAMATLPMPGMSGHHDFPHDGDRDRLYLKVRPSGEYDALYPRWFGVKK